MNFSYRFFFSIRFQLYLQKRRPIHNFFLSRSHSTTLGRFTNQIMKVPESVEVCECQIFPPLFGLRAWLRFATLRVAGQYLKFFAYNVINFCHYKTSTRCHNLWSFFVPLEWSGVYTLVQVTCRDRIEIKQAFCQVFGS